MATDWMTAECPVCGSDVPLPNAPMMSELVDCPTCETELEIVSLSPLSLEQAPKFREDWGE